MSNEELACAVQKGNSDALAQLWEQVKDYAYTVVMRYTTKPYADTEDYLQTAFLGVRAAALAFDPSRGSFLTVADWYIRQACSRFYRWHRRGEVETISYDVPMKAEDPDGGDFKDNFPDDSLPDPWEDMEREDLQRDMSAAIDDLTPRCQRIIRQHYYQGMPLEDIGKAEGVTGTRIQQIEQNALKKLRHSKHLASYAREYAPVKGVGMYAFMNYGTSAVEYVAIKNADAALEAERRQQRAAYLDYVRWVMWHVQNGWYSLEMGWIMVDNYKVKHRIS